MAEIIDIIKKIKWKYLTVERTSCKIETQTHIYLANEDPGLAHIFLSQPGITWLDPFFRLCAMLWSIKYHPHVILKSLIYWFRSCKDTFSNIVLLPIILTGFTLSLAFNWNVLSWLSTNVTFPTKMITVLFCT